MKFSARNLLAFTLGLALLPLLSLSCATSGSSLKSDHALTRIGFGSCAKESDPQPIWDSIIALKPELFLLIGDNIYGDTTDMTVLKSKYDQLGAQPGYVRLRETCPILATWDDHDFGKDDAGVEFSAKRESQRAMQNFFGVPTNSPLRQREGVYDARVYGPPGRRVQVILLDTRYFRTVLRKATDRVKNFGPYTATDDPAATVLGDAQWSWLREQLQQHADVRLICSSIQVVPEDHGWEKWMNHPREREKLYRLIRDTRA
ncbi:MAG: alkaline phosphatase family protein, partial [Opitutaceae bacterium]|nr:alkaline phosphatase family protein [Verrucomicrobiales bacterium]